MVLLLDVASVTAVVGMVAIVLGGALLVGEFLRHRGGLGPLPRPVVTGAWVALAAGAVAAVLSLLQLMD